MISNVIEQLFRLTIISIILPKLIKYGPIISVTSYILFNILSESISIIVFLFFLPKNKHITKEDLKLDYQETKEILNISIPSISGRLLGNIGFFFEPILLTSILSYKGLSITYITQEYAIYNTYAIGTLLFPSFFISAISNALLPEISSNYEKKNIIQLKRRINQSLLISFLVGLLCTTSIYILKEPLLNTLYHTNKGINYIKILSPFFILFYLEAPLSTILIGMNKVKTCTLISTTGIILKLIIIAEIINIIYITLLNYLSVSKQLKKT